MPGAGSVRSRVASRTDTGSLSAREWNNTATSGLFENPPALQRLCTSASRRPCRQLWYPGQALPLEKICGTALILLAVSLSACGGGGGGGGSGSAPPEIPTCIRTDDMGCLEPDVYQDEADSHAEGYREQRNFKNQWGLSTIHADRAYAHVELIKGQDIAPGTGVTIGFVDSGIDQDHLLLDGAAIDEVFLFGKTDEDGSRFSHGTSVASVAAAPRLADFMNAGHGVAWGADMVMFSIPLSGESDSYSPLSLNRLASAESRWSTIIDTALGWRDGTRAIDFLNLSVGFMGIIDNYSETELRDRFGDAIEEMAQASSTEKTILVWAGGNAHGDPCTDTTDNCVNGRIDAVSVEIMPGLVARIPELQGHTVAVVATNEGGEIADFSNRCGIAADWCLAAPGEDILAAYFGPREGDDGFRGLTTVDGTSFAAPMVTGGLAVMKHLFRDQLSNTDLLARLLATADSTGRYSNRSIYGQGMMDLGAATSPVGVMTVTTGDTVNMPGNPLQTSQVQLGTAFGDGFTQSLLGHEFAAFDALGAPFWFDMGNLAVTSRGPTMAAQLHEFLAPALVAESPLPLDDGFIYGDWTSRNELLGRMSLGLLEMPMGAGASHFALAEHALALTYTAANGMSATAFTTEGIYGETPASGAEFSWRPLGSGLGLRAGWLGERETLLGSVAEGAFGKLAADAFFIGFDADMDVSGWQVGANAELGMARPETDSGLITGISQLTTSAFALHASRVLADTGTLRISLSQPLRVERGRASLNVPMGRTRAGEILRSAIEADLAPSGRQIDFSAQWQQSLTLGELRLGTVWTHEPNHHANADPEWTFLSGWLYAF
ncbi:MAG: S8 family serine peptidase [Gammaproteobacteria bacterium]|nr:S8 family serine peptidase [Gammaproteobacteria bacterium]